MDRALENKIHNSTTYLKEKSVIVAFSGGVDSTVVASLAQKVCKEVRLITIISEWISDYEIEEAEAISQHLNIPHDILKINIEEHLWNNPPDRCFHCKLLVFSHLLEYCKRNGYDIVVDGTNASDIIGHRPGLKALKQLGIYSPLLQGNISKSEVRQIAKYYKLPIANKPAMACLASRIPYGMKITREKLTRVQEGEKFLRELGFSRQLRLRDHNTLARLEIDLKDFTTLLNEDIINQIVEKLHTLGYSFVTLDLEGYRPSIPEKSQKKNEV
ncbi:MAG: ATP-dependent sacrificial sulfur transferase LarE [Candidatus Hodarchaeota archaeon]